MPHTRSNSRELRDVLPALPCSDAEPAFSAPWQARAFAMTLRLHELGVFKRAEWTECLGQTIREAQAAGELDYRDTYYYHWLAALERTSAKKGLVTDRSLAQRQNEWDIAARNTPHGQPIEIKR
ncbi:MAG: putative metal chaperone, involved in Fe-nitrile hydratase activation, GTPase of COG0523 family [uncultured Paraburkholderia sp.]|nr:MAG: putative metal chaperone, involved in Fe-nitrile hydratase activation, GTPase of COG0523 family [uncultured Paraburkholderia sp.]